MRRFVCVLVALCLLPVLSVAEDYNFARLLVQGLLEDYQCDPLPEDYYALPNDDGTERRYFFITNDTRVVFVTDGETTHTLSVVCSNEAETRDFLVACLACLAVFNVQRSSVLYQYLLAKTGDNAPEIYNGNIYAHMTYSAEKNQYTFVIMEVNAYAP